MTSLLLALLLVDGSHFVCGNDASLEERLRAIDARRPAPSRRAAVETAPALIEGTVVMTADDANTPFDHPFDIGQATLRFRRRDAGSWLASRLPLTVDPDYGARLDIDADGRRWAAVPLPFEFPFYERTASEIFVTPYNAIHLAPPLPTFALQMSELDVASGDEAIIAPMLTTEWLQFVEYPDAFVKSTADFVRVTWARDGRWKYVVQATITAAGDVTFAYDVEVEPYAAVLAIKDGRFSGAEAVLGEASDPAGDAPEPMLDILSARMSRIGSSNLVRFRIETAGPVSTAGLGEDEWVAWSAAVTDPPLMVRLYGDGRERYTLPGWGIVPYSNPAARIDGNVIELDVLDEHLAIGTGPRTIRVETKRGHVVADEATVDAEVDEAARPMAVDVARLGDDEVVTGPVIEAFTLPVVNVHQVWRQLRDAWHLDDASVDAVAVYQNFRTDIILYASAYSSGGNPGVDNIIESKPFVGNDLPRSPALMHMNFLGNGLNRDPRLASHNLMHELGHRWLYDISIVENGSPSRVLNPLGGHPAQYVHTPAAFPVERSDASSVMGGGTFEDHGDGSFSSWPTRASSGYSWTDLYLMGLASKHEVTPWFYLANSDPALGPAYYPPANRTYEAARRDVAIDQVVGAMGPRHPAYPDTQNEFRVVFVLLARQDDTGDEIEQIEAIRTEFERRFRDATGHRAEVRTWFSGTGSPRRRLVRR